MARSYAQRRYARLRKRGLCGSCGKVKTPRATCPSCSQRAKERRVLATKGKQRCGHCLELGHTRRTCPEKPQPVRHELHDSDNGAYRKNRANRLCDRCGRPSARSSCEQCALARKLAPSRQPEYLAVQRAKQDRRAEYARRNERRRALAVWAGRGRRAA